MKIIIIYFSGTGNTKLVSKTLSEHLILLGNDVSISSIEKFDFKRSGDYDCIGFGFPVYAWQAPKFYRELLEKKMPSLTDKAAFVFNTRAISSYMSNYYVAEILRKKGFIVFDCDNFTTPPNDWMIFFKKDNFMVKTKVLFANDVFENIKTFANRISDQLNHDYPIKHLHFKLDIRAYIASKCFNYPGMLLFNMVCKKWSVLKDKCTRCRICVDNCPSHNITIDKNSSYPIFSNNCVYCFRCINKCPEEAIQLTRFSKDKYRYNLNI